MKRLILLSVLAVAACAPRPAPEPIVRTIRVEVPVPVPCDVDVVENDVDLAPLIRAAGDHLARVELVLDALAYVTAQRDSERTARKACQTAPPPRRPDPG